MVGNSLKSLLSVAALVSMMTLGSSLADKCFVQPITYECFDYPNLVVTFDKIKVSKCGGLYDKSLFPNLEAVTYTEADVMKTYTVAMVDPDAPRHEAGEAYLHWLCSGVQGSDLVNGMLTSGHTVTDYAPPTPPRGTGVHRYLFYLYRETGKTNSTVESITERRNFELDEYATQQALCGPVAFAMFSTQY